MLIDPDHVVLNLTVLFYCCLALERERARGEGKRAREERARKNVKSNQKGAGNIEEGLKTYEKKTDTLPFIYIQLKSEVYIHLAKYISTQFFTVPDI